MITVKISEESYDAVAEHGKFGDSFDDALRRALGLVLPTRTKQKRNPAGHWQHHATNRLSTYVQRNKLFVEFKSGAKNEWTLPAQDDKEGIRRVRDAASEFAEQNDATLGQVNAVKKALTEAGYYVSR